MITKWTGELLIIEFEDGTTLGLNAEQTKEFDTWVQKRVKTSQ